MEEPRGEVAATTTVTLKQQEALCEECKTKPSKYKCPGCSLRTCSLPCVSSHKQRTSCTGKRDLSHSVPLSQFDDNLLISDFNLLEDVKRVAESARRKRVKLCAYPQFRIPFHLKSLRSAASSRRTRLLFLPSGMSRRERNQSRYNQKKKFICWTIEWRFHSTDVVLLDHGIHESTSLRSVIEKHLQPSPWIHKLRKFCEEQLDHLKFFIRKYPKGPNSPFRELYINAPVSQLLANLVILEYPVIQVFLPSHSYNFEVIRDLKPPPAELPEPKASGKDDYFGSEGVLFKEEEIGDGVASDPQMIDLLWGSGENALRNFCHHDGKDERESDNSGGWRPTARGFPCINSGSCTIENVGGPSNTHNEEIKDFDFDFEQDLIDAYSSLIAQSNPDDFLDFNMGVEGAEELEEGEIPGSD
ncbi:hypothetical protein Nepgr_006294 [Nepenthes gracilis]|uniref:Box C/D snoRNA protein 1 n=1 Tax=Nepenthes gracilis TaxID=150966 RepID=A0AAD3XH99_NEPGR|nr:hypothetical protein Nepgr_006294 [Nepenthes gracilis]